MCLWDPTRAYAFAMNPDRSEQLSSLLVRDGVVSTTEITQAFQRQVLRGGTIDTSLLELELASEQRLLQYLALASGLPPATSDDLDSFDPHVRTFFSAALARKYDAIPLVLAADAVRILVHEAVTIDDLENLADELNLPLQPFVTTELRWQVVASQFFGQPLPARFAQLLEQRADRPRQTSVVIGSEASHRAVPTFVGDTQQVTPLPMPAPGAAGSAAIPLAALPAAPKQAISAATRGASAPGTKSVAMPTVQEPASTMGDQPNPPPIAGAAHVASAHSPLVDVSPATSSIYTTTRESIVSYLPVPPTGIDPNVACAALDAAQERREVVELLLSAARRVGEYVALLRIADQVAEGEAAIAESDLETAGITDVRIALDMISPYRTTLRTKRPYAGPLTSGNRVVDAALTQMGCSAPPFGFLVPLCIRERVIGMLVGYHRTEAITMDAVESLLPVARATETAFVRIVLRKRASGEGAKRRREPTPVKSGVVQRSIAELIAGIMRSEEDSFSEGHLRFGELQGELLRQFPGPLLADRRLQPGLRASEYGPLLGFLAASGSQALDLLATKVVDRSQDVRFFATVCLGELGRHTAIPYLAARTLDADPGVRAVAISALLRAPLRDRAAAAISLRPQLKAADDARVAMAISALRSLRDSTAVPELIGLLSATGARSELAHDALITLTKHDFGRQPARWQMFWNSHKHESRTEWLIAATGGSSEALRREAHLELIGLHGDVVNKPSAWLAWWRELHNQTRG